VLHSRLRVINLANQTPCPAGEPRTKDLCFLESANGRQRLVAWPLAPCSHRSPQLNGRRLASASGWHAFLCCAPRTSSPTLPVVVSFLPLILVHLPHRRILPFPPFSKYPRSVSLPHCPAPSGPSKLHLVLAIVPSSSLSSSHDLLVRDPFIFIHLCHP